MSSEELFRKFSTRAEKILIPLGIWPSSWNWWVTLFNITVLFVFSNLVLIKNILNPEQKSIENAFTLANGGLINVVYFVTMFLKKEPCAELYEFIKTERKFATTSEEKKILMRVGKQFQNISKAFLYFLPLAILVRFFMPTAEFAYVKVKFIIFSKIFSVNELKTFFKFFAGNKTFELPPAMGLPIEVLGEIPIYIIESFVRALVLISIMGICIAFILSSLTICSQFEILSKKFEDLKTDDMKLLNDLIEEHKTLLG